MNLLSTELIITFSIYSFFIFYLQKWSSVFRGGNPYFETFLNFFMGFATIYGLGFLVYFGYKFNWSSPLILFGISLLIKGAMIMVESILFVRVRYIVEFLGKNNKHRPKIVIGFAAETENLDKNALSKLKQKNCDIIIANDVSKKDSGFNSDYNRVSIIDNSGKIKVVKKNKKSFIANIIAEIILDKILINDRSFN